MNRDDGVWRLFGAYFRGCKLFTEPTVHPFRPARHAPLVLKVNTFVFTFNGPRFADHATYSLKKHYAAVMAKHCDELTVTFPPRDEHGHRLEPCPHCSVVKRASKLPSHVQACLNGRARNKRGDGRRR